jgi:hypothetical protein
VCPACGEVIKQVIAMDGVVKGWCPQAKKAIKVEVTAVKAAETDKKAEAVKGPDTKEPTNYLDRLKQQRAKVLRDVVSAREDGDLKENAAYHAAREQMSILDSRILQEEDRIKRQNPGK